MIKKYHRSVVSFFFLCSIVGCAGVGVFSTDDPAAKLRWAQVLVEDHGRDVLGERLIFEAIAIYKDKKDEIGMAEAYRVYGILLKSPAVARGCVSNSKSRDFIDKSITCENRYTKALEYFEKTIAIDEATDTGTPQNIYLLIGLTKEILKDKPGACASFDKAIETDQLRALKHPEVKIQTPKGKSFSDFMEKIKSESGC